MFKILGSSRSSVGSGFSRTVEHAHPIQLYPQIAKAGHMLRVHAYGSGAVHALDAVVEERDFTWREVECFADVEIRLR
ncbi:MAG TPA: hypothetical protein VFO48_06860, partial [Vicinamibacterales bacterium]|nr:hypothetical protein [Vicinamibacterales bacterium]